MKIFLIVAAAIFCGLMLFLIAGYLFIRWKLRSLMSNLTDALGGLAGAFGAMGSLPPYRLELESVEEPPHNPEALAEAEDYLRSQGFESAGRFQMPGSAEIMITVLAAAEQDAVALLYDVKDKGVRADIAAEYVDDRHVLFTSNPEDHLEKPDNHVVHRLKERGVEELYQAFLAERPDDPRRPVTVATAVDVLKASYDAEMAWRARRGGYTDEEIRLTIQSSSPDEQPDESTFEMVKSMMNGVISQGLEEDLREAFLEQSPLSAAEWDRVQDRLVVIHPMTTAEDMTGHLGSLLDWPEEDDDAEDIDDDEDDEPDEYDRLNERVEQAFESSGPFDVFQEVAPNLPQFAKVQKIEGIKTEIRSNFYIFPDSE